LQGKIYYASAFFSQQAVEKILKAYYIQEKRSMKKTHSVSSLAKDLKLPKKFLPKIVELEEIHRVARYPGISEKIPSEEIEKSDAINFYNIAQEVLIWIKAKLK
jgi:HEPN domain-containing protein